MAMRPGAHVVLVLALLVVVECRSPVIHKASVTQDKTGQLHIVKGIHDKDSLAWGTYRYATKERGWDIVDITTSFHPQYTEADKFYAAGYLEGYFTASLTYDYYQNAYQSLFGNMTWDEIKPVVDWIRQNDDWVRKSVMLHTADEYWEQAGLFMRLLDGFVDGATATSSRSKPITRMDVLILNLNGDIWDLLPALIPTTTLAAKVPHRTVSRCTGFIRLTANDLFSSHNTWDSFQTMNRLYKNYHFPSTDGRVKTRKFSMSSYPATFSSTDDFYVLDSGLWVGETTNNVYNLTIYKLLTPNSIASWLRAMTANRLATNGKHWTELFSRYNSGTYNNQWMITDYNLYHRGMTKLPPNTVWIAEQTPGFVKSGDVTSFVNEHGYWGSYNVPYFKEIFDRMGYPLVVESNKEESWSECSRARIFRRDANKVQSMEDMQRMMQYNDYQNDPISEKNPCNSIAARCDLTNSGNIGDCSGALDAKITNSEFMKAQKASIISGPTHQTQPPFQWSDFWGFLEHLSQPNLWNYNWFHIAPHGNHV